MKIYFAHIWKEKNNTFSVEFPDLPGCFSYGDTLSEAKIMAQDALIGYLDSLCSRNLPVPEPSLFEGNDFYPVETEEMVLSMRKEYAIN